MQTYYEQAALAMLRSEIAAAILLSPDGTDVEFVQLHPYMPPDSEIASRIEGRGLRSVAVAGFGPAGPRVVFKEILQDHIVNALGTAFMAWVDALIEADKGDDVSWLQKLWSLPDTRSGN